MEIPIWEYNGKLYLKFNDKNLVQYSVDRFNEDEKNGIEAIAFKKDMPYIMDLTFSKYDFEQPGERITGYTISTINKIY